MRAGSLLASFGNAARLFCKCSSQHLFFVCYQSTHCNREGPKLRYGHNVLPQLACLAQTPSPNTDSSSLQISRPCTILKGTCSLNMLSVAPVLSKVRSRLLVNLFRALVFLQQSCSLVPPLYGPCWPLVFLQLSCSLVPPLYGPC